MTTETYPHLQITQDGVPLIAGTKTKVVEVVLDRMAHHWDADEIQRQHPHLTHAQIYAALAYYHDHQDAMGLDIAARLRKVEDITASQSESTVRAKLRAMRKLP